MVVFISAFEQDKIAFARDRIEVRGSIPDVPECAQGIFPSRFACLQNAGGPRADKQSDVRNFLRADCSFCVLRPFIGTDV